MIQNAEKRGEEQEAISSTFLLLAASSACLTRAVPSAVTCCITGKTQKHKLHDTENQNFPMAQKTIIYSCFTYLFKYLGNRIQASRYPTKKPIHP